MGATLVLVLLRVNETNLNTLDHAVRYPLYLTIGNLSKRIHHQYSMNSYVLVAYFLVLKAIGAENDKNSFTEAKQSLYQNCMWLILDCLHQATIRYFLFSAASCISLVCT